MDLIPSPGQVVSAAANLSSTLLYGGPADLRPMPRTLVDEGPQRAVYHYRPHGTVQETGDPILLVTPLAAPALCWDLRRGCSLVEHLVEEGRPTYVVEYGTISFADRNLGMEHWIDDVVPEAIRATSEHAGGRPVHVVGWSLGGLFAVLVAADAGHHGRPTLPIGSLTLLGSPVDVSQVPLIAPVRPRLGLDTGVATRIYRILGGAPQPLVKKAFQLSSFQKYVTKPYARFVNLDDSEFLAQLQAVDRFTDNLAAYPGRTFGQLYHRMLKGNDLEDGVMELDGREIRLDAVREPVLVLAGNTDGIAPIKSVQPITKLLSGSSDVRFEIVPGGHLGMLTGRGARTTTWRTLDEWVAEKSTAPDAPRRRTKRPADPRAIGANPDRTYRSAASRKLAGS
ncbi:MAG: alpha/beta hydrolase [Nocardioidaceae bacterium]|nr:alpha/beta hydrolase [Nocardioidaceae bacterium]